MNDEHAAPGLTISCQEVVELVTDYLQGGSTPTLRLRLKPTSGSATAAISLMCNKCCRDCVEAILSDFDCLRRPGSGSWRAQQLCR